MSFGERVGSMPPNCFVCLLMFRYGTQICHALGAKLFFVRAKIRQNQPPTWCYLRLQFRHTWCLLILAGEFADRLFSWDCSPSNHPAGTHTGTFTILYIQQLRRCSRAAVHITMSSIKHVFQHKQKGFAISWEASFKEQEGGSWRTISCCFRRYQDPHISSSGDNWPFPLCSLQNKNELIHKSPSFEWSSLQIYNSWQRGEHRVTEDASLN